MKPQQARGMHSGFWLLPEGSKFTDGDASAGTEIDVMEFFGETPNGRETIGSFVYYYEADWRSMKHGGLFRDARQSLSDGASWWDEFHVFSMEWTPEHYIFRVDGREYYREDQRRLAGPAVPRPVHARLGLRARRADCRRARRHRRGRLGAGLGRHLDGLTQGRHASPRARPPASG